MKAHFKNILFAAVGLFLMASCNKTANLDDASKAIPKDAVSVTALNLPSLFQKADFEAVKQMEFYKAMVDSANTENAAMADILRDPRKSGVDLTKNVYLVQDYNLANAAQSGNNMTALMSLSNASDFETMLKSSDATAKIETKDGIKFILSTPKADENDQDADASNYGQRNRNRGVVAWNDKLAIIGTYTEGSDFTKYFKQKPEESIAKNEQFGKLFGTKHDMYSYMSFDKLADDAQIKGGAGMMNLDPKSLKGNYATGYADFENGQIVSKSDYQINADLRKQWGIMFKDNVKTDFSKYLKGSNLGFAMTMALDVKGIKEIINTNPQFKAALEMGKGNEAFSTDDIFKAFDGDMVVSAAPLAGSEKWSGMMGFKLNDKAAMLKLVNYLVAEGELIAEGNDVYRLKGLASMMTTDYVEQSKLAFVDDVVFVGDAATISSLKTGGGLNADVKEVLNKNIFGLYANFGQIFANTEGMENPEVSEMKMTMTGKKADMTMKTRDANENALKSLMKAANRWYLKSKADEAKRDAADKKMI